MRSELISGSSLDLRWPARRRRSIGPGFGCHHRSRIFPQPLVVVTADLAEEGEAPRLDAEAGEGRYGHRARELRHACLMPAVEASRLLDERVRGQQIDVAGSPRPPGERVSADGEVVVRLAGVIEHEAAVVERQLVSAAVDDRVEHGPDRIARGEDRFLFSEGSEVDGLTRLQALDVRVAGSVKGDA